MSSLSSFAHDFHARLQQIQHITLISHRHPDGDAFGCLEGMRWLLENNYPHLAVDVVVPESPDNTHISWILGKTLSTLPSSTDLVLVLDTSLLTRTALPVESFQGYTLLAIDHHESPPDAVPWFRDVTAPSTTVILTETAHILQWTIDARTATALLLGLYTDTWAFIHTNTDARAFGIASQLLGLGADQHRIAQQTYGNYSLEYLRQLGQGLLDIIIVDRVAILCLPENIESWLKRDIVGYLSGLENVDIACVLRPEGALIAGSLRTRYEGIDVNIIAQKLWGGGHKKAAGFLVSGSIQDGVIDYNNQKYSPEEFARLLK